MKVRSITNKLSLSPRQEQAIKFAFDSARAISNFALDVALNEIHFIPGNLPSKTSFYKSLIGSKNNKPQYERLKDKKLVVSPKENYYLPKGAAQSVIFDTWASLNSFKENFLDWQNSVQSKKKSKWRTKPNPPQKSVEPLGFTLAAGGKKARSVRVDSDTLTLPAALGRPVLPFPSGLRIELGVSNIQRVRLFPRWGEIYGTIIYKIEVPKIKSPTPQRCIAIDLGVDSFAVVNNIRLPPLLFKLSSLKYKNYKFRKELGRLNTIYKSQGFQSGPARDRLLRKRYGFFKTKLHRLTNKMVKYCVRHSIDHIIIGYNAGWKQNGKLYTKRITSAFQLFPYNKFIQALRCEAERVGIEVVEQEESYTSKASFDDGDFPSQQFRNQNGEFSGHILGDDKESRRWYITARGYRVHRDLNAAANILKKYSPSLVIREDVRIFEPTIVKW